MNVQTVEKRGRGRGGARGGGRGAPGGRGGRGGARGGRVSLACPSLVVSEMAKTTMKILTSLLLISQGGFAPRGRGAPGGGRGGGGKSIFQSGGYLGKRIRFQVYGLVLDWHLVR